MAINILFLFVLAIIALQIFLIHSNIFYMIFLFIEAIIFIYFWLIINKKRDYSASDNLYCNQSIIEIMNKYRHDMSNNVQIISCYATLKRNDDIVKQIDIINNNEQQLSLIAAFADISLTAYLYKIHALFPDLTIKIKIEENIKRIKGKFDEKLAYEMIDKIINVIYLIVDNTMEQNLSISIGSNDNDLIINLEFEGSLVNVYDKILGIEKKMIRDNGKFIICLNTDQRFIMDMYFPLKKV